MSNIEIIKYEHLNIVINLLSKGFSWNQKNIELISRYMINANKNEGFYGFFLKDNQGKVEGAILTPIQGEYYYNFSSVTVATLVAWYVIPSCRGTSSIRLAKYAFEYLKHNNYVITNYTPNPLAKKLFISFNFTKMNIVTLRFYFYEGIFYYLCYFLHIYKLFILPTSTYSKQNLIAKYQGSAIHYKILLDNHECLFTAVRLSVDRRIFGFKFTIAILRVTAISNPLYILKNLKRFLSGLSIKFRVFYIELDIDQDIVKNSRLSQDKFKSKYLIYSNDTLIKAIPFIGSELVIF